MSEQQFAFFNELIEENRELKMKFGGQQGIINSLKEENVKLADELLKEMEEKVSIVNELEKTNKAMYNRLKEQSEIIYQLIQKLKEHITEKELKELMEDCGL